MSHNPIYTVNKRPALGRSLPYQHAPFFEGREDKNAMAFVPVANTVEVQSVYELAGQVVENTFYYEFPSAPAEADIVALLTAVKTVIVDHLIPLLTSSITLVRLIGTLLT